jgi:hypothetical protein
MPDESRTDRIREMLDKVRPDRYDPADHAWHDTVNKVIAAELTDEDARAIAARRLVRQVEGDSTKATNRLLREIHDTGQLPIGWLDAAAWPLAVSDHERVALRAASVDDLEAFAARERRAAANDFATRNDSCEGALSLAALMSSKGCKVVSDLDDNESEAS